MKIQNLITILLEQDKNSDVYIDIGSKWFQLEEKHILPAKSFSSFKETTIDISEEIKSLTNQKE